ncbi:MAG: hypothetical protein AAGB04_07585 [Pseudomonadota bacterium]
MPESLSSLMRELKTADVTTALPDNETWEAMIDRIKTPQAIHQISEQTYWYFLEVLPPKWMDRQHYAFAEGEEPLQLFWESKRGDFRTRLLSWEQTRWFYEAVRLSSHYGSM